MAAITTDGANMMDRTKVLEAVGQSKMGAGGSRNKNRSRSASVYSQLRVIHRYLKLVI